ncbi:MAG TPA: tripartite tricarboxylate transporter substrate binding protein, partial [Burkholderiales bacterium]|nr:tripartite tricarboxylate transporter substrate binding protein [Burkholderiales bacterium]
SVAIAATQHRSRAECLFTLPRYALRRCMVAVGFCYASLIPTAGRTAEPQAYPSRPLRFIVPFPPSGTNDIIARALVQKLSEDLGQPVVVDNRGGANGIIGMDLTAKSPPDGHTFLIIGGGFVINPSMYRKLPFDPVRDFTPVSLIGNGSHILVVHPSLPARNVEELIALAKTAPGKLAMASAGIGNLTHLAGELFMSLTGARFVHVPYKGGGPAVTDLIGGQVSLYFSTIAVGLPHVRSGKLRALAVSGAQRSSIAPDIPTIAEAGVSGYAVDGWYAMLMAAHTPPHIVGRFAAGLHRAIQNTEVKLRLASQGIDTAPSTPDALRKMLAADTAKWAKVLREAGIQPE